MKTTTDPGGWVNRCRPEAKTAMRPLLQCGSDGITGGVRGEARQRQQHGGGIPGSAPNAACAAA